METPVATKRGFIGPIVKVLQGVVSAQAIAFLALPILTRQFSPEAFGHFQIFQSVGAFILVFSSMRYEVALLRAESDEEFAAVARLCLYLCVGASAATGLICLLIAWFLPIPPEVRELLWTFPVVALVGGGLQALGYVVQRQGAFGVGAVAKIAQSSAYVGTGTLIGAVAPINLGLVVADLVGRAASIFVFARGRASMGIVFNRRPLHVPIKEVARRYKEYPRIAVPGGVVNTLGGLVTSAMLYGLFSTSISGQYGLVERAILLPLGMVAGAIGQVYTANLSHAIRTASPSIRTEYRRLLVRLTAIGIGPTVVAALVIPQVFDQIFGAEWKTAGELAQVMCPLFLVSFVSAPVHMVLTLLGYQFTQIAWDLGRLVLLTSAWTLVAHLQTDPKTALTIHTCAAVIAMLAYLALSDLAITRYLAGRLSANVQRTN